MRDHLSDESLMDALEGAESGLAAQHLSSCPECAARVGRAREGLALTRAAEVPEPSPLYWESFPRQVARRLDAPLPASSWRLRLLPALATAMVAVAALIFLPRPLPAPARTLPPWSALPPAADDPALPVLQALGPALDPALECGGVAECLADLTDEESRDLVRALRPEVKEGGLS